MLSEIILRFQFVDLEGKFCVVDATIKGHEFCLIGVYVPNASRVPTVWPISKCYSRI